MKKISLLVLFCLPCYLMAQQNLSWEEKVSPKYSYKLPEKEKVATNVNLQKRESVSPYQKLLTQREELKDNIAHYEQNQNNELDKQFLDKYRASLAFVEKQILTYSAPPKKEKNK